MPETPNAICPAVAIPIYKPELTATESLSIDRSIEVLAHQPVFVVGPHRLDSYLQGLCRRYGQRLRHKTFADKFFTGIAGYNSLMLSKCLYQSFSEHSHLLISQTDALVLSDQLEKWCEADYSYIGAPWLVGGSNPTQPIEFLGVGNGGFSLRRVDDFLRVLTTVRHIPNFLKSRPKGKTGLFNLPRLIKHEWCFAYNIGPFFPRTNEDFFWGLLVPAICPFFRVPKPAVAIGFAFEVAPRLLYEQNGSELPFGCHAWERYDRAFWEEKLSWVKACA